MKKYKFQVSAFANIIAKNEQEALKKFKYQMWTKGKQYAEITKLK